MKTGKSNAVIVVGGGVAGIEAAMNLAESGCFVYLVEKRGVIGGTMVQLDKIYPTNDCAVCLIAPRIAACSNHPNVEILTLSQIVGVTGRAGDFTVTIEESPRFVDPKKCVACGACVTNCPQWVSDDFNVGDSQRKAIYIRYPQAVPMVYQIDAENCLHLLDAEACGNCQDACLADAISFDDKKKEHQLHVKALILAPGFEPFHPGKQKMWGYGKYPDVITSIQLERLLSATGPTGGKLIRPSDGAAVTQVAFVQCVGSRDENGCKNGYCSTVCCMASVKEVLSLKQRDPSLSATIYYNDMRATGKKFDLYVNQAKEQEGVEFVRCRVAGIEPGSETGNLTIRSVDENGRQIARSYDLVVLSVGIVASSFARELAEKAGIQLFASGFASTSEFAPVTTSKDGIYVCGAFAEPKGIAASVVEGAAAAAEAATLVEHRKHPTPATLENDSVDIEDTPGDTPAVGVFICHCGTNIADMVNLDLLGEYVEELEGVSHVERSLFLCSRDGQQLLINAVTEKKLNRVVIAACSPLTHEHLFRRAVRAARLNEFFVEIANIRNHSSWVHRNRESATQKAMELVKMAVAKVLLASPQQSITVPVVQRALVVGGGITGMTSAYNLAERGYQVDLIEKGERLGGNALNLKHTYSGVHVPSQVVKYVDKVRRHQNISVHLQSEVIRASGFVGNYTSTIRKTLKGGGRKNEVIEHGVCIVATGAAIYRPEEYGYKKFRCVVTSIEFEKLHELKEKHVKRGKTFVFIQCVGSREEQRDYCSKVCCTHSVQSAIELKREDPARDVYILYRDMRTYGEREYLLKKAREMGIVFINYELHGKPRVDQVGKQLVVDVWDHILHRPVRIKADMVILAAAIVSNPHAAKLAQLYSLPLDNHGFFQEAQTDLCPVDFLDEGMFLAGMAHFPKPVDESIAEALAAASRAATLLAKREIELDGLKAIVNEKKCDGCALCVDVCPYYALEVIARKDKLEHEPEKLVAVNRAKCKGCGICQGTCPMDGIDVAGFTMEQLRSQVRAALENA